MRKIRLGSAAGASCHGCGLLKVLQLQLPHRSGYYSGRTGSPGLSHQDDGEMRGLCLPFLHLDP